MKLIEDSPKLKAKQSRAGVRERKRGVGRDPQIKKLGVGIGFLCVFKGWRVQMEK